MRILEELWYGNINPVERNAFKNDRYAKLIKLSASNKDKLSALLSDEAKVIFEKLEGNWSEISSLSECEVFISGFRLGARLMIEVMQSTESTV
ncbi:MAG: hypothetical protein J1E39_05205 [Eubacterium sp.]|nr:hypothetical protein [Eubacterium sp.]